MTGSAGDGESGEGGAPAERRLRIAAHNGAPEFGGAERATALLLEGLAERGHEVRLFYNRDVVARGMTEYGIELRRGRLGGDLAVHHAVRFALRLRRYGPDVLVVGTFRKLWLAALAGRLAGVPVVARIGLSTDVPRNLKYEWVFRHWVSAVVANAEDLANAYRDALPDAPPPLIRAIHKGIESRAPVADPVETRRAVSLPPDRPVVGGVGRLVRQKRYDRLLRTVALLPPRVHCLLVGDGPLRADLESLASELGVADRVRFTGYRDDVPELLAALDLLLVTSDRESLANVMLEALSVGTPVVSTPVSGAAEALARARTGSALPGLVVEPEPERLAGAVSSLLDDPERLDAMAAAASEAAELRFGRERMLHEWEALLRSVVRGPG